MRPNPLKRKLRRGEAVVGAFCNIPSPAAVEVLGLLGFDFVILDGEHSPADLETVEHMVRAAEATGITPLVRVALNLRQNILRFLDTGAMGVLIPMVNTPQDARAVVGAVKYPPLGQRGLAAVRAAGWGIAQPLSDYVRMANEETLVAVQIETRDAVANADGIINTPGVDLVFVGPSDLSSSMGYPGQPARPEVVATIEGLGARIRRAGKWAGTIARDPDSYGRWRRAGFQFLCTGVTNFLASAAAQYLQGCRQREGSLEEPKREGA